MELAEQLTSFVKKRWKTLTSVALLLGLCAVTVFLSSSYKEQLASTVKPSIQMDLSSFPITIPNIKYGVAIDTFTIQSANIKSNQFFGNSPVSLNDLTGTNSLREIYHSNDNISTIYTSNFKISKNDNFIQKFEIKNSNIKLQLRNLSNII